MSNVTKRKDKSSTSTQPDEKIQDLKFGPMPTFPKQRQFVRVVIVLSILVIVYFSGNKSKETLFASRDTIYPQKTSHRSCSQSFQKEVSQFTNCVPKRCGRGVFDKIVTEQEVEALRRIAISGLAQGKATGSASILDLHSGAVSHGENFINIYKISNFAKLIKPEDFVTYKTVRTKIQHSIAALFLVDSASIHLTHPTFFANLTAQAPRTVHDEYWHNHVDKETYNSFHFTALLYLSDFGIDFEGGRFLFIEQDNSTNVIEPMRGRVSIFTSGAENPHRVERVTKGHRLALTIGFTCDSRYAISDPTI